MQTMEFRASEEALFGKILTLSPEDLRVVLLQIDNPTLVIFIRLVAVGEVTRAICAALGKAGSLQMLKDARSLDTNAFLPSDLQIVVERIASVIKGPVQYTLF